MDENTKKDIKGKKITVDRRSVSVFDMGDSLFFRFHKNEGTCGITTDIRLSREISKHTARLVNETLGIYTGNMQKIYEMDIELFQHRLRCAEEKLKHAIERIEKESVITRTKTEKKGMLRALRILKDETSKPDTSFRTWVAQTTKEV